MTLVAAVAQNAVIGRNGSLPWHIAEDLRLFRFLTRGKTLVVGRKTFQSPGFPLADRKHIVVDRNFVPTAFPDDAFVVGGAQIYRLFWPRVRRVFISLIHAEFDGDVFLPEEIFALVAGGCSNFQLVERRFYAVLPVPFTFYDFRRRD
ncbi:MAG: dihydrofolate reductase [Bacteroidia bacterium]|nr:dihydrofolate reductase [Bacteroidia bacterium]MDW8334565.1 dihydrofolate reductase [Bacteroidia bacterium]